MHEKGLQKQKGDGPLVSSQGERALLVPLVSRGSTADFVPPSVYIGFRLFVLLGRRSSDVSSMPRMVRWTFASWANSSVGTQSCPTLPGRSAGRPDPTRPWYVRVLDSTNRISLVCASGETFTRRVLAALGSRREACFLGEQFPDMPCMKRVYKDK